MRRLLAVCLLVCVLGVALTGCEWLTAFLDDLDIGGIGSDDGGNGTTPAPLTAVLGRIEIGFMGTMELQGGGTSTETVGETFFAGSGAYDAATRTFTATWDDSEFTNTYMEIRLDTSLDWIEIFTVRQTRTSILGDLITVTEVTGHDVPYTHGGTGYGGIPIDHYTVTGVAANAVISSITQRMWSTNPESVGYGTELDPWKLLPAVTSLVDDIDDDIMITLGWQ